MGIVILLSGEKKNCDAKRGILKMRFFFSPASALSVIAPVKNVKSVFVFTFFAIFLFFLKFF